MQRNLYPNLYTLLVGPSGSGKTIALEACEEIWRGLDTHYLARTSLTKPSLMDELSLATRHLHFPFEMQFNSLMIASKELGALLPKYDPDFLNALTTIYDCNLYDEKRRSNPDPLIIERPQINLIACTTPNFLVSTMPAGAWEQGFLSRVIIIYSDVVDAVSFDLLDEGLGKNEKLVRTLAQDMKKISERAGRLPFTREAAVTIENWNQGGRQPSIDHPRLMNYSTRRGQHILKLCMVACIDRDGDVIELEDFQKALGWLLEAEAHMVDVFLAMQSGGDAIVINETWHYVVTQLAKTGRGTPLHEVYTFLSSRLPASTIQRAFELMLNSNLLKVRQENGVQIVYPGTR